MIKKKSVREKIRNRLKGMRKRAVRKNMNFDLTIDWYINKLKKGKCEATGTRFEKSEEIRSPFGPSVDRDNTFMGYTMDNCRLVSNIFNLAKADFTEKEVTEWLSAFVERYEEGLI